MTHNNIGVTPITLLLAIVGLIAMLSISESSAALQGSFSFPLSKIIPQVNNNEASISWARGDNFPIPNMALGLVRMNGPPGQLRMAHWHPNAVELTYVITGQIRVSVVFNGVTETFLLDEGDVFYSPIGYYHYFEKVGTANATLLAAFSTTDLVTFELAEVFGILKALSKDVLAKTFNVPVSTIDAMHGQEPGTPKPVFELPQADYSFNPKTLTKNGGKMCFLFKNLDEERSKFRQPYYPQSSVYWATAPPFKQLQKLSFAEITLKPGAFREPLWYTNVDEVVFVIEGAVEIGIAGKSSQGGKVYVQQWDIAFTPQNFVSYISNNGTVDAKLLLIFNSETPQATGFREVYSKTPAEVLGTIHRVPASTFSEFKKSVDTPNPFRAGEIAICPTKRRQQK